MTANLHIRRRRLWRVAAVLAVLLVGTLMPAASAQATPGARMIAIIKATPAAPEPLIAFRSDRGGHLNIWVMEADGANPRNLTNDDAQGPNTQDTQPAWSPGGLALAYGSGDPANGPFDLWVITADGKHRWRLTHDADAAQPAWAPRFFTIAFGSIRGDSALTKDGQDIFSLDLLTGEQRRLTTEGGAFPQWSPDGSRIAFFSRRDGNGDAELYVMSADGSNQTRLTHNPANDFVSSWSPDGRRLAFARTDASGSQIWILDLTTMTETQVTNLPGLKVKPDWSPDGLYLLFHGTTAGTADNEIFRVRTDGSDLLRLTTNPANDSQPDWQPRLF